MNSTIENLGWTLVHSLWEGAVIWLGLQVALAGLRRSAAKTRYLAGCAALIFAVLAPGVTFFRVELRSQRLRGETAASPVTAVEVRLSVAPGDAALAGPEPSARRGPSPLPAASAPSWISELHSKTTAVLPWVVLCWVVGCGCSLLRLALNWKATRRLARIPPLPLAASLEARCRDLARQLGIRRAVQISQSALVGVPSVVSWLKPTILIPVGAFAGLTPEQVDGILAHELGHVLRHDFAVNLLQSACEVLFFYHPAIWAINRTIRTEREHACDDIAVELTGDARGYAAALAKLEEARYPAFALAATGGGSLLLRIRRLMAGPSRSTFPAAWAIPASALVYLAVLLGAPGIAAHLLAAEPDSPAAGASAASPSAPAPMTMTDLRKAAEAEFPYLIPCSSQGQFAAGDGIIISAVRGNRKVLEPGGTYLVEGTYRLASLDDAILAFNLATMRYESNQAPESAGVPARTLASRRVHIVQGSADFILESFMPGPGKLQVSFYPSNGGAVHGGLYLADTTAELPSPAELGETDGASVEYPYNIPFQVHPADDGFADGDDIQITAVRGDRQTLEVGGNYLVEGRYRLASADRSRVELSLTTWDPISTRVGPRQNLRITRGTGSFALEAYMSADGEYHVKFSGPHRGVYFTPGLPAGEVKVGQPNFINYLNSTPPSAQGGAPASR